MKQRATTDTMTFNQTMGKLWDELIERGPQPTKELNADTGKVPYPTRLAGLTNFRPTTSTNGGAVSGGGHKLTIYYIEGEHTPRQVVEAWFEANPHTVETHTKHALAHRMAKYGSEYAAAVHDILDETDNSEPHNTETQAPRRMARVRSVTRTSPAASPDTSPIAPAPNQLTINHRHTNETT